MLFDVENKINECWNIVDDLRLLNDNIQKKDLNIEQIKIFLNALETIYELKFQTLFDEYDKLLKETNHI